MSKIEAWKCDKTGQIFTDLEDYKRHLKTHALSKLRRVNARIFERDVLPKFYQAKTTKEFEKFIRDNLLNLTARSILLENTSYDQKDLFVRLGREFIDPVEMKFKWKIVSNTFYNKMIKNNDYDHILYISIEARFTNPSPRRFIDYKYMLPRASYLLKGLDREVYIGNTSAHVSDFSMRDYIVFMDCVLTYDNWPDIYKEQYKIALGKELVIGEKRTELQDPTTHKSDFGQDIDPGCIKSEM